MEGQMIQTFRALRPPLCIVGIGALVGLANPYVGAGIALFGAADTYGRYRDYCYLRRFDTIPLRLAQFYGRSYCGRTIVTVLFGDQLPNVYRMLGYKWYHFLPDNFPSVLLKRKFWRGVLFGHRSV
jgi:hypothetical protein